MSGWIKLYRKSLDHWLYKENRPHTKREVWEDLLLYCNHSNEKVLIGSELIECNRGQSIKSLSTWSKKFNWTVSKVRRFFILLEKDSMIRIENVKKTTRLTICKYEDYQGERNEDETIMKRKRNASEMQVKTNKNVKNDNNVKNINIPIFEEFKNYVLENNKNVNLKSIEFKYKAWCENDWKDGNNKKITNWKTKILNTLQYLPSNKQTKNVNDKWTQ